MTFDETTYRAKDNSVAFMLSRATTVGVVDLLRSLLRHQWTPENEAAAVARVAELEAGR